ncbi:BZ3500_MvSof-1268-A1-R1_Chr4-3g07421 [Microbotryum saponariae]|uniref:BZ3500_MvSof-1268-A1-R1_Chr4-3g07421 protein n=1 Tax=Microbotryum saponariae TaxID=289078 RepID=A0A2X0LJ55_9BASI|nr:BZ3500_MvSof-1268-A1-R1_Chr4-3g07421 [Microbotryum saponariae]SDA07084.1 BZ3501_MvSof-1269-A2-R1_Chr4-2g07130 [Microbotryum saponariae]
MARGKTSSTGASTPPSARRKATYNTPDPSDVDVDSDYGPSSSSTPVRRATHASSAVATSTRGPVPLSSETSYHKRTRTILLDHRRLRREWNELVLRGLVGRIRSAIELYSEVQSALKVIDAASIPAAAEATSSTSSPAPSATRTSIIRTSYILSQSHKLSENISIVNAVLEALVRSESRANSSSPNVWADPPRSPCTSLQTQVANALRIQDDRLQSLLLEASATRGIPFAFKDPLWVTWPLAQFADGLADLTESYTQSLTLVRSLVNDTLIRFPPLPASTSDPKPISNEQNRNTDTAYPTAQETQVAMSLLVTQPLIQGTWSSQGPEAWEEFCSTEVGGWD